MRFLETEQSPEQAERRIRNTLRRRFWTRPGELRRVELVWIPFHLFECPFRTADRVIPIRAVVDAVEGEMISTLDATVALAEDFSGGPLPPTRIEPERVRDAVLDHTRWLVIQGGMLGAQKGEIIDCKYVETIAYPFWVGYIEKRGRYDVRVLDGLTGESTGPKVKRVVLSALVALQRMGEP